MNQKIFQAILLGVVIILVASNAATVYILTQKQKTLQPVEIKYEDETAMDNSDSTSTQTELENSSQENISTTTPENSDNASFQNPVFLTATETQAVHDKIYAESGLKVSVPAGKKRIKIDWDKEKQISAKDFFLPEYENVSDLSVLEFQKLISKSKLSEYDEEYYWNIVSVGKVSSSSDKYAGDIVYGVNWSCFNMGCSFDSYLGYVVADQDSKKLYLLSDYSGNQNILKKSLGFKIFSEDTSAFISELENPEVIDVPNSEYKLRKQSDYNNYGFSLSSLLDIVSYDTFGDKYVFNSLNGKKVYLSRFGCFIVYNENGGRRMYYLDTPVADIGAAVKSGNVLDITFNDGSKNKKDYVLTEIGGCGSSGCGSFIEANSSELLAVGKFSNGDIVYEYKPETAEKVKGIYDQAYFYGQEKPSWEEFLASHSIVLWKTPIKDYYWLFKDASYVPAVECGKPVIYLYPEETTDVKVEVKPTGGLTITEPEYNNGWLVKATPESELYNYADQKNYPYLFWEGKGVFYERPQEGFVVARADVDKFLDEKLSKLGLIEKEIKDFKEFWAPKMQERPYYFVTFLPQADFNNIAPLNVSPKPDTIIRVFMDYEGLDSPINVIEQKIKTPQRIGFTVVEWGGALGRN